MKWSSWSKLRLDCYFGLLIAYVYPALSVRTATPDRLVAVANHLRIYDEKVGSVEHTHGEAVTRCVIQEAVVQTSASFACKTDLLAKLFITWQQETISKSKS